MAEGVAPPLTVAGTARPAAAALVRTPSGACALLGATVALLVTVLPDAVLLPAVDRWPPRQIGLMLDGLLISAGWWLAARRERSLDRRAVIALGLAAVAGGFLAASLLPWLRGATASGLRGGSALPYYPLVVASCLLATAPVALPLGALLALALGRGRRGALAALLLGGAVSLLLGPYLHEVLLGGERTLQVAALLAGSVALLLAEQASITVAPLRLPQGAGPALLAAGGTLLAGARLLDVALDRGTLVGPALAAAVALAAAGGVFLGRSGSLPLYVAAAAVAMPLVFPSDSAVDVLSGGDLGADVFRLLLVALPAGLTLGALLARRGDGAPLWTAPALLLLLAPAVSWVLLPRLGPRALTWLLAMPVVLASVRRAREHTPALIVLGLLFLASAAGFGPAHAAGSARSQREVLLPDGAAALVDDPATGRTLLALDGRAPFGRSAAQERRFAHLPLLLHGSPDRVLVIASGNGETASAAWSHGLGKLHWLKPLAPPDEWAETHWPGEDAPVVGGERQFLAVERPPYDVIVMDPEPREGRRAALIGTVEFFRAARARLRPDGLLCQWWDLADIDVSDLKSVIASAHEIFENSYLLMDHPRTRRACLGLLLSQHPLRVRPATVDAAIARHPAVSTDMALVGLDGLSLASLVIADRGMIELLAPREEALHDDRPTLGVRGALRPTGSAERLLQGLATFPVRRRDPLAWIRVPQDEQADTELLVRDRYRGWQHLFGGAARVVAEAGPAGAAFDREPAGSCPEVEAWYFLQAFASLSDWDYLLQQVLAFATRLERDGRRADAEDWLRRAILVDPACTRLHLALGALVERKGDLADAAIHYTSALTIEPENTFAVDALASVRARLAAHSGTPAR